MCNNCLGWGHDEETCPSDKRPRRPGDCIDGVQYLKLTKRRPFDRRDQAYKPKDTGTTDHLRTKKGRFQKRFKFHDRRAGRVYMVETDDDGNLYVLDTDVDEQNAPEDDNLHDTVDSHALVQDAFRDDNDMDAFGVIPPTLDTNMA